MRRLADILADRSISGIFLSAAEPVGHDIRRLAEDHGFIFFHIEGKTVDSKERFLAVVSKALRFPDYFGMNWDAFEDCLTDMSPYEDSDRYLIVYDGFEAFAAREPEEFNTAVEIFKDATSFWAYEGKRMIVVLSARTAAKLNVPQISL